MENISSELKNYIYDVIKVVQMTSRKDARTLPLFQIHLELSDKSKKFLKLKVIFKIRVEIENYRPPRKPVQCWN